MGGIVNNGAYKNTMHVDKLLLNTDNTSQGWTLIWFEALDNIPYPGEDMEERKETESCKANN